MTKAPGSLRPEPVAHVPAERDESVTEICRRSVERLAARLPDTQVCCHLRVGDALRVLAAEGALRLIYEVRRDQGGICWRAIETRRPQLVEDVRRDPDYLTTDARVLSELAVPVRGGRDTQLVLDAEFVERTFTRDEAEAVLAEATRLEAELTA